MLTSFRADGISFLDAVNRFPQSEFGQELESDVEEKNCMNPDSVVSPVRETARRNELSGHHPVSVMARLP
jgi:hypothetical protein